MHICKFAQSVLLKLFIIIIIYCVFLLFICFWLEAEYVNTFLTYILCLPTITTTIKTVLMATFIKHTTCIKQSCNDIPKQANTLKCTRIKQAPVLNKHIFVFAAVPTARQDTVGNRKHGLHYLLIRLTCF